MCGRWKHGRYADVELMTWLKICWHRDIVKTADKQKRETGWNVLSALSRGGVCWRERTSGETRPSQCVILCGFLCFECQCDCLCGVIFQCVILCGFLCFECLGDFLCEVVSPLCILCEIRIREKTYVVSFYCVSWQAWVQKKRLVLFELFWP